MIASNPTQLGEPNTGCQKPISPTFQIRPSKRMLSSACSVKTPVGSRVEFDASHYFFNKRILKLVLNKKGPLRRSNFQIFTTWRREDHQCLKMLRRATMRRIHAQEQNPVNHFVVK
ncbi:hypothetical protein TNCT_363051 [Trichonephila clavata]|uniref:Uncharacterized protein n=1 Tax=Trichonephila clavata TaxID=2740835 RepID=A0A8X6HR81_TRICU|nr:hypothetical protein TNCT_363051 [Trichonephila clavata]